MQRTLMEGLDEKNMQAIVRKLNYRAFYYPTLFPFKQTIHDRWKTLERAAGLRIAADVVSVGSSKPQKSRDGLDRVEGNIPKIAVERIMREDELREYNSLLAMSKVGGLAGNNMQTELVKAWADDVEFCFTAVASRLEDIALRQISRGKVSFNAKNNAAVVTQFDADYEIPTAQKIGVDTSYSSGTSGKPISIDIPKALELGRKLKNATYKVLFMNQDTFIKFARQTEVIKSVASFAQNVLNIQSTPSLEQVNTYLASRNDIFRGLQIRTFEDPNIIYELADGSRNIAPHPFDDDVMLFSESEVLGETYWAQPTEAMEHEGDVTVKAMQGHTCVRRYYDENRITEITDGAANAFPAWNLAGRSILMQTNATSWTKE